MLALAFLPLAILTGPSLAASEPSREFEPNAALAARPTEMTESLPDARDAEDPTDPVEREASAYCGYEYVGACHLSFSAVSDCSDDGAIGINDIRLFAPLVSGPRIALDGSCCCCADVNGDGMVALDDYAIALNWDLSTESLYGFFLSVGPGMGYCPSPGMLYYASIYRGADGVAWLIGSRVVGADPAIEECMFQDWDWDWYGCLKLQAFERALSSAELNHLDNLLAAIPPPLGCNYAYDPCNVQQIQFGQRCANDYCYNTTQPPYTTASQVAVHAVYDYVRSLVGN